MKKYLREYIVNNDIDRDTIPIGDEIFVEILNGKYY